MNPIAAFLKRHIPLSVEAEGILEATAEKEAFSKNQAILRTDNLSKKLYFIEKGLARVYYAKEGKDITLYFLPENGFGMPVDSIFYNMTCKYGIEALEKTTCWSLKYADWEKAMFACRAMERFSQRMLIAYIKRANDHLYSLQFQSAKERLELLQKDYPDILLRAPLGDIASYLGIAQETLSRLRSEI